MLARLLGLQQMTEMSTKFTLMWAFCMDFEVDACDGMELPRFLKKDCSPCLCWHGCLKSRSEPAMISESTQGRHGVGCLSTILMTMPGDVQPLLRCVAENAVSLHAERRLGACLWWMSMQRSALHWGLRLRAVLSTCALRSPLPLQWQVRPETLVVAEQEVCGGSMPNRTRLDWDAEEPQVRGQHHLPLLLSRQQPLTCPGEHLHWILRPWPSHLLELRQRAQVSFCHCPECWRLALVQSKRPRYECGLERRGSGGRPSEPGSKSRAPRRCNGCLAVSVVAAALRPKGRRWPRSSQAPSS